MTQPSDYSPSIPQPSDSIAEGQPDFLTNFSQLFNAFESDHVALNAGSSAGNHSVARLVEQPNPLITAVSELAIYSKDVPNQTDQLFLKYQGNGQEIQYSNYQIFPLPDIEQAGVLVQKQFFSFLPGGIIIYFGFVIPNGTPFTLLINPVISTNIFGINLGVLGNNPLQYPSNVALLKTPEGKFNGVSLTPSAISSIISPPQSYIIFGNTS